MDNAIEFHPDIYNEEIANCVKKFALTSQNTIIGHALKYYGILYKKDLAVLLKTTDEGLEIGSIISVLVKNGSEVYFLVNTLQCLHLVGFGLYGVCQESLASVSCIPFTTLLDYYPVAQYYSKVLNMKFITLHHAFCFKDDE